MNILHRAGNPPNSFKNCFPFFLPPVLLPFNLSCPQPSGVWLKCTLKYTPHMLSMWPVCGSRPKCFSSPGLEPPTRLLILSFHFIYSCINSTSIYGALLKTQTLCTDNPLVKRKDTISPHGAHYPVEETVENESCIMLWFILCHGSFAKCHKREV